MARTSATAAPVVSFVPAMLRNGHVTDGGRSYFFTVTPGEGVRLRPQLSAGEIGARLPVNSKVALRSAVLAAYRAAQAAGLAAVAAGSL